MTFCNSAGKAAIGNFGEGIFRIAMATTAGQKKKKNHR